MSFKINKILKIITKEDFIFSTIGPLYENRYTPNVLCDPTRPNPTRPNPDDRRRRNYV